MTKELFDQKLISLLEIMRSERTFERACGVLFDSPETAPESFGDDHELPKLLLSVAMRVLADQLAPVSGRGQKVMQLLLTTKAHDLVLTEMVNSTTVS